MRGRKASAALAVDRVAGSATAKERAKAIYQVLTGQRTIAQACTDLALSEARFHQLKEQMVTGSVAALEPRPAGRPAQPATPAQAELAASERQRQALQLELGIAQTSEALALVLPRVVQTPEAPTAAAPEKKTRYRHSNRRRRPKRQVS